MRVSDPQKMWKWPQIKCALEERGLTFARLALTAGVSRQAVAKVKYCTSRPVQDVIARAIGVPAEQIWPERYQALRSRRMRRAA